uniref:C2H2-type domain-containing protein n=1 Tax=Biomphalaria glabrata TaxID=6526 RepID=A0A2C9K3V5_BIOGL
MSLVFSTVAYDGDLWCLGAPKSLFLLRTMYTYLEQVEKERDLLVCGDCQTSFALQDIVLFIKHKKLCCDKENVDTVDGRCRKPGGGGSNNNNEPGEQRGEGGADQENEDASKSSSRREEGDLDDEDLESDQEDSEEEEDSVAMDTSGYSLVNGEAQDTKLKRRHREDRSSRTPLRPKQVADAESNTTHSEPSRFICETCRSTYTSAWALLQHAQKEHGMKIYTSPTSSSTPVPIAPLDLVVPSSSPRSGLDHRSVSSTGSGGSASPFPVHPTNPFSATFRLPLDSRIAHPTSISPFSRPNFDFDLINDYRIRPQLFGHGAAGSFDRARAHLSPAFDANNYDYYSMRLKQLASSPMSAQSKSPFSANQSTNASGAPTSKPGSPSGEASAGASPKGRNTSPVMALPPKLKACEFCGKSFRFQSNLVVHRRSHTGEKPYKCSLCPHACTQQSKLKRHMKTHSNKAGGETLTGDALKVKEEDDADDAEDEDDEDEDNNGEDDEDEEEELDLEDDENEEELEGTKKATKKQGEETTPEPGEIRHEAKRIKLEKLGEEKDEEPSDLSTKTKPVESLLSEVMKNSVLNSIPTYTEAFKAALAESQETKEDKSSDKSVGGDDSPRSGSPKSPRCRVKRELESEKDSDKDDPKDRLYKEISALKRNSAAGQNWTPVDPVILSRLQYPLLYNPAESLFFSNFPHRFPASRDSVNTEGHNGLNLSPTVATTSSALKNDSPSIPSVYKPTLTSPPNFSASNRRGTSSASSSPTGSLLLPSNGSSAVASNKKESRRNDTCEFCGKVFKNCSNLTVHRRSHTGEKPYKCSLCSYACAQSSKLTRHMKTHGRLGKDVYTCKFCNMPFSVPSTLEKHMRKCVENRNARLLAADTGDLSSESNGEVSRQSDSTSGVY